MLVCCPQPVPAVPKGKGWRCDACRRRKVRCSGDASKGCLRVVATAPEAGPVHQAPEQQAGCKQQGRQAANPKPAGSKATKASATGSSGTRGPQKSACASRAAAKAQGQPAKQAQPVSQPVAGAQQVPAAQGSRQKPGQPVRLLKTAKHSTGQKDR